MRRIVLHGDMTLDGVARALRKKLGEGWEVEVPGFNTWLTDLLNLRSAVRKEPPDVLLTVLSPRFVEDVADAEAQLDQYLDAAEQSGLSQRTKVFVTSTSTDPVQPLPLLESLRLEERATVINRRLREFQDAHSWFFVLDQPGFLRRHGVDRLRDTRFEALGRRFFSPPGEELLAGFLARAVRAAFRAPKKVLALDLDGTLWGGNLGDDGREGIRLGADQGGYPFLRFQRALLALKQNGVLLAICSKNDEPHAVETIDRHPDMILRMADFAAHRINWVSKAENLRSLAEQLSLGTDAFVFFDDSSVEREQMRQLLPEVEVIDVPADPVEYVRALSDYPGFDALRVTEEDRARTEMYRSEGQRSLAKSQSKTFDEFCASLEMTAELAPVDQHSLSRAHQLILKTNQFNLTTRRYEESELVRMVLTPNEAEVFTLRLKDRCGESGLTGVVVIKKAARDWELDSFLLSCRIIGRTVEFALMRWLADRAKKAKARRLVAEFKPTERNRVAADFLPSCGFVREETTGKWILDLFCPPSIPNDYVAIIERPTGSG